MIDEEKVKAEINHAIQKKRIVFYCVCIVSGLMILLWGLAFKNMFTTFSWSGSSEKQLYSAAKNDMLEASDLIEKPIREKAEAQEVVKNTLKNIIDNAVASSSQNVSTTSAVTSTN